VADVTGGIGKAGGLGRVGNVLDTQQAFRGKLSGIRDAASEALSVLKEDLSPDEVTLRFGIKITAEGGAVVARAAVEGNMEVEMSWRREPVSDKETPSSSPVDDQSQAHG
jgi:NTP-dependent ternary system trypsin peptidase co-occuring protein